MSNTDLIIEERSRDIGDFLVGRLIPFRKKRMVGPFIFIDHMGPADAGPGKWVDIDQHPHIGLSTLTYLFEGEIEHQDSLGTKQRIRPGSVNWMTAGKGVTHTERTPADLSNGKSHRVHGYQVWVALPKELEQMEPRFHHTDREDLPSWEVEGARFILVAGEGFGRKSPVPVHSDLFMVDIRADREVTIRTEGELKGEIGIAIVDGEIQACEHRLGKGNMLVAKSEDACDFTMYPGAHVLLFGGAAYPEERLIFWNFVASSHEILEKAKEDWKAKRFPSVPGDTTYIPLPKASFGLRRK